MINFRFHLASLVAIFLALALGVVIGAGVIDRGVVDALDNRLNRVEANSNRIQAENDELQDQIGDNHAAIAALANQALASPPRRLAAVDVGVVAVRGVDDDRVSETVASLTAGGADVTGVLWLESPWTLETDEQISSLGDAIGSSSRRPATLREQAWQQLAARFASGVVASDGEGVIEALDEAGFVAFDAPQDGGSVSQFPGPGASIVLIVGTDGDVAASDVVMPAANAIVANALPLVIGDVYDATAPDAGDRGGAFVELRRSSLSTIVSTVNDLDRPQGPPTVALALADLLRVPPVVGHYGLGDGTIPLPAPVGS